jgi:undecaprenyl-diphosphatase
MILTSLMQDFRNLDVGILKLIYENRVTSFDPAFIVFTDTAGLIAFGVPSVLLIFSTLTKNPALRNKAALIFISVAFSAIVANILKYTIDLPRPYELYPYIAKLGSGGSPSFPSGHTADAFAFFMAVSLIHRKWFVIVPCFLWASLVGYSRMSLGVHFPSDVLAGALIGILSAILFYSLWIRRESKKR